jgi:cysteinyl-tRNA synthetase
MKDLLNDLNTAKALASLRKCLKDKNILNEEKVIIISIFDEIFSLGLLDITDDVVEIPDNIIEMAEKRWQYKKD